MTRNYERHDQLIIPARTELNFGPSEDSESIVTTRPVMARIVGEPKDGAQVVRIIVDGQVIEQDLYLHQPPVIPPNTMITKVRRG